MLCQVTLPAAGDICDLWPGSRVGIVFDSPESVWGAARSPGNLTEQVEAAARDEAGPDEGDKTPDAAYPPQV
jgi:hypothetical protein